jgi:hypothetical protein
MAFTSRAFLVLLCLLAAATRSDAAAPTSAERTDLRRAENQFNAVA